MNEVDPNSRVPDKTPWLFIALVVLLVIWRCTDTVGVHHIKL